MGKSHTNIPECCGRQMDIRTDLGRFLEVSCQSCGDSIYIKKETPKPQMIDD